MEKLTHLPGKYRVHALMLIADDLGKQQNKQTLVDFCKILTDNIDLVGLHSNNYKEAAIIYSSVHVHVHKAYQTGMVLHVCPLVMSQIS